MRNTLRVVIVDDERAARTYLSELLAATGEVSVVGAFESPEPALVLLQQDGVVDAVFADVNLGGGIDDTSGLEWAARLGATAARPLVVMATAHPEHALTSYELGAVDYLLKPWTRARVEQCVLRLQERRRPNTATARIAARSGRALRLIPIEEALAFEAEGRLTYVHTASGRFDIDLTLTSLAASFEAAFARTHRQWLVALEHVREIQQGELGMQLLVGGDLVVPVASERTKEVRRLILQGTVGLRR
jgi:DNA-binding LytR/AlgR family response regulator